MQTLISLPPAAARHAQMYSSVDYAASDPPGHQLGSGGGTASLLACAWQAIGGGVSFTKWLGSERKLIIHASGQSRRLPAYAAEGKSMLPLPRLAGRASQKLGQTLLDLQCGEFTHLLRHAPSSYVLAVSCGDTLVRYPFSMPEFPDVDVLILGIPSSPEEASAHGVLFSPRDGKGDIEMFLQKPSPDRIRELSSRYDFSLDSGVWLLSQRAVDVLMRKCGWDAEQQTFANGIPSYYELYDKFGEGLGRLPASPDSEVSELTSAVLSLCDANFYHFGTNRSVLHSISELRNPASDRRAFGHAEAGSDANRIVLNSHVSAEQVENAVSSLWIENSYIGEDWCFDGDNVITGIPRNKWRVRLARGACVDSVEFASRRDGELRRVLRVYGFDDAFKGLLSSESTKYLGRPFTDWLSEHGISLDDLGETPDCDLQNARIFPLVDFESTESGELLNWILNASISAPAMRERYLAAERVSATDLVQNAVLTSRAAQRVQFRAATLEALTQAEWENVASSADLAALAGEVIRGEVKAPAALNESAKPLALVHEAMFRTEAGLEPSGTDAFSRLSTLMVGDLAIEPASPSKNILDDQIVWGRSPARLDLAGGWSDTPPYCIEHGGRVVNVAVDLNGQPPIQAFVRVCKEPKLILRSIDLGLTEQISTFEDLAAPSALGAFSIPRAALRLAGFDPAFSAIKRATSLDSLLMDRFGGGLELTMLSAIPRGSGLGTSSILAATVLGALADACGLGWSVQDLFVRTSALEQLLTSGGGWQDQVGGVVPGLKIATTRPGMRQIPDISWLPETMFRDLASSGCAMLYYTGITRVARSILAEIVKSIFLNDCKTLGCIEDIACNATFTAHAIEHADVSGFREALRRSWALNKELDSGTCPELLLPLTEVLDVHGAAYKLLGAGGGGYMLIVAPDIGAAAKIRAQINCKPLSTRARFVDITVSKGLQITRS